MAAAAITLETLKSKPINEKAIEKGVALYEKGKVDFAEHDGGYIAEVNDGSSKHRLRIEFSKDGQDLEEHYCMCNPGRHRLICKHIVAAVLAVQGGIVETSITLGKTATISMVVSEQETAARMGSGTLAVFATPMMIALMERAACAALADGLHAGQASVGTRMEVSHDAASPIGAVITATAEIISVSGRRIHFAVTASDDAGIIGKGKHIRALVAQEGLMRRANARLPEADVPADQAK